MELSREQQEEVFSAVASAVALKHYHASTIPAFETALFSAYLAEGHPVPAAGWIISGAPAATEEWIREALEGQFQSVSKPPRWTDDPHWPFFQGAPMTFVHQFPMPETEVEEAGTIFVFSARRPNEDGMTFTLVYKLVKQTRKGEGTDLLHALDADQEE